MNVIVSVECFTMLMKENHNDGRTPLPKNWIKPCSLQLEKGHWISWGPFTDLVKLHSGSPPTHLQISTKDYHREQTVVQLLS